MNFLELTKKRFSVRNYKSDRVEQDKIDYIIECITFRYIGKITFFRLYLSYEKRKLTSTV